LGPEDRIKKLTVGRTPKINDAIVQLDDVFTAGDAKYEANTFLKSFGRNNLPLLAIALDRQEVAIDGVNAIAEYTEKTGTKVVSIVNAVEVYEFLEGRRDLVSGRAMERLANYIRVFGTNEARRAIGSIPKQKIIALERSVIPACDVETLEEFEEIVKQTHAVRGIGAYKVGFDLGLGFGLPKIVETARKYTDKPIIYDHQKAGTDIPDTGKNFARRMKNSGIDTVILFPQAGTETERAWIYHALDYGLNVIVGGPMTHPGYKASEGGYLSDEGVFSMIRNAAKLGINNFVVPGTKLEDFKRVVQIVKEEGIENPSYYSPGLVEQGGKISEAAKIAGKSFHGIVGRGIYGKKDMHAAAVEHCSQL
jgi:orotidine-5'-phosphate decarboxylase